MNTTKYIGINLHQATSVFAIRDHQGKLPGEAVLETKPAAIIDFLKGQRGTVWATFEEGTYSNWLYDVIHPHVAKLLLCDPRKNKREGSRRIKGASIIIFGQRQHPTEKERAVLTLACLKTICTAM